MIRFLISFKLTAVSGMPMVARIKQRLELEMGHTYNHFKYSLSFDYSMKIMIQSSEVIEERGLMIPDKCRELE
jgi:hypothetical protein